MVLQYGMWCVALGGRCNNVVEDVGVAEVLCYIGYGKVFGTGWVFDDGLPCDNKET